MKSGEIPTTAPGRHLMGYELWGRFQSPCGPKVRLASPIGAAAPPFANEFASTVKRRPRPSGERKKPRLPHSLRQKNEGKKNRDSKPVPGGFDARQSARCGRRR